MTPLEEQILVPRTGTIASLGLCPLSEVLSSVLELCNVNCGHPYLQHDVVSEKSILPGSFLSRLEEEVGILFRLLGKLHSPTQLEQEALHFGRQSYTVLCLASYKFFSTLVRIGETYIHVLSSSMFKTIACYPFFHFSKYRFYDYAKAVLIIHLIS